MDVVAQRFAARWSRLTWIVTAGASAVVIAAVAGVAWAALYAVPDETVARVILLAEAAVLAGIFISVAFFAPRGYGLTAEAIIIRRLGPDVIIARGEISKIRQITSRDVGFAWRLFGSGGFLGSFGYFYSRPLGRFRAYVTNSTDLVLIIRTDGTRMLISPFPPDEFVRSVQQRVRAVD